MDRCALENGSKEAGNTPHEEEGADGVQRHFETNIVYSENPTIEEEDRQLGRSCASRIDCLESV